MATLNPIRPTSNARITTVNSNTNALSSAVEMPNTELTRAQPNASSVPTIPAYLSLIDADVFEVACNWPLQANLAAATNSAMLSVSAAAAAAAAAASDIQNGTTNLANINDATFTPSFTKTIVPTSAKNASMSSDSSSVPITTTTEMLLPALQCWSSSNLRSFATDAQPVVASIIKRKRTESTLHQFVYTPTILFPPTSTKLNKVIAAFTSPFSRTVSSEDKFAVASNDARAAIYRDLGMRATASLRRILNCYYVTLGDCTLGSLLQHQVTLRIMFECDMGRTFTIVDWMKLFQLHHLTPDTWLQQLGYHFTLHAQFPTLFNAQTHAAALLRITWAKHIRGAFGGFVSYDELLSMPHMLRACDLAALGFSLADEVEHNLDFSGVGPAWGLYTKAIFLHMAMHGCWSEEDARTLGLNADVAAALKLTQQNIKQLKWSHNFAIELQVPPELINLTSKADHVFENPQYAPHVLRKQAPNNALQRILADLSDERPVSKK